MRKPIAILTCRGSESNKIDERSQMALFQEYGFSTEHVVWNEPRNDWNRFQAVFIRSTWDYQCKGNLDFFLSVLKKIESAGVLLLNPLKTVEWNCRKNYLAKLPDQRFCIESIWLKRPQLANLAEYMNEKNWKECVIKPQVSAFGVHTYRFKREDEVQILGNCLLSGISDWVLQPFLKEVIEEGEWSFVIVNGKCIHTILKRPAPGNFLVHGRYGGVNEIKEPPSWMVERAESILANCGYETVVARVDLVRQGERGVKIMEIEAIDCFLFFEGSRELNEWVVRAVIDACKNYTPK